MAGKRTANGESSVYRDDGGRWHGYVSMGYRENGKPDRRHVSGKTRKDVVDKVRALEAARDSGVAVATGRWTTGMWLDHWMANIAPLRVRPTTLQGYESKIRVHIKPAIGHVPLQGLQPEHLEQLYATMSAKGQSGGSQLVAHNIIRRALKVAVQRGRVARNVALLVESPVQRSPEVEPLTADDARRIIAAAAGERNAARWTVALALGVRQGEALGGRWADVDLERGVWSVAQQQQRVAYRHGCNSACADGVAPRRCPRRTGGTYFAEPKTVRGKRRIGIPPQLLADLRSHRQSQLEERIRAGSQWHDLDLVFCHPNGKPIDGKRDHTLWKRLLAKAGVRDARLHDARHTAATLMLAQGVQPRVVMEVLGHSSTAVTENIYQHVMPAMVDAATTGVANVLYADPEPTATTTAPRPLRRTSS